MSTNRRRPTRSSSTRTASGTRSTASGKAAMRNKTTTRNRTTAARSKTMSARRSISQTKNRSNTKRIRRKSAPEEIFIERPAGHMDYTVLFLVTVLVGFGLVMIYSTSSYKGSLYQNDSAYWLKRQALFGMIGFIGMLFLSKIDYHRWAQFRWLHVIYYGGTLLLLILTLIFAAATNGSKRWLYIGPIGFQPSEIAKITMILFLSYYIATHIKNLQYWQGILVTFGLTLPIIGVVGIENLSTSIILLAIAVIMIFVSSPKWKPFIVLGIIAVIGMFALFITQSYRIERFTTWLDPEHSEKGLQTMQGLYAIGSGGLFGKGLGQSMQKMGFVPEPHNDMIFSIICEELGLFGAVGIIVLFGVLLWRFKRIAWYASDLYGSLIVIGVIAHIGIQVFVNIGVVTNTIPNTGVPLPFISYGGTSLVFLLLEIGLVLSVSRYAKIQDK